MIGETPSAMLASLAFSCGRGFFHSHLPIHSFKRTMKQTVYAITLLGMIAMAGFVFSSRTVSAKPADKAVNQFMQQKLTDAQDVLEGLVTEDFDQIERAASDMHTLSQAAEWQVLKTPTYDLFSKEFQTACTQLEKAAKEKNTDGASLAWIKVTMTCLSCHKHVRNAKVAQLPAIPENELSLRLSN
jgi:hypothetical protein